MKNITLRAEKGLIEQARRVARAQRTTLNAAFRKWLQGYVARAGRGATIDALMDHRAAKAKLGGKDRNEYPGVERVEKNLEEGIEGHQAGRVFGIAPGQFIPDDDHGTHPQTPGSSEIHCLVTVL